jgi:phosphoenolpyruvate-protein phosphotransferase
MTHETFLAPLDGIVVDLARVPDPSFAAGLMGDGIAIEPLSNVLLAPCDGVITHLAKTGHALTLTTPAGTEILIHVGIDTVLLQGDGFRVVARQGDHVRSGDSLITFDLDAIALKVPSLQTVFAITSAGCTISYRASGCVRAGKDRLLCISSETAREPLPPDQTATDGKHEGTATVRHHGGLHARPAAALQAAIRELDASVFVKFGERTANVNSLVALMALGTDTGSVVSIRASGADASAALLAAITAIETATQSGHNAPVEHLANREARPTHGVCASPGITIGTVMRLDHVRVDVPQTGGDVHSELTHLHEALKRVRNDLSIAAGAAHREKATSEQSIFEAHKAMIDDPDLVAFTERQVLAGISAGYAFKKAIDYQAASLIATGNAMLAHRVGDLHDIEHRVLSVLGCKFPVLPPLESQTILVADDLTPSQLAGLQRDRLAGVITACGGATSHVAILARSYGIPALVAAGAKTAELNSGQEIILDATNGVIEPAPTAARIVEVRRLCEKFSEAKQRDLAAAQAPAKSMDGVVIEVAANIAKIDEIGEVLANGADGVGLLRTEFLFDDRDEMPSEDEQREAYQSVVTAIGSRPVIIRTLDAGGDKPVRYLPSAAEVNPALGLRGIRTGLANPLVLDEQLRALLRVRGENQLHILIPMVSEVSEIIAVKQRMSDLCLESGITPLPRLGVMIEIPSAALLAEQLAKHVDFFSIGTNDLTQYTLAMDRCHPGLAGRLDPLHPSILKLIAMTTQGASLHGKWVGMCGGMASDPEATPILLGLGLLELSVSPPSVPAIKARIRALSVQNCREQVSDLLKLESAAAVRAESRRRWPHNNPIDIQGSE